MTKNKIEGKKMMMKQNEEKKYLKKTMDDIKLKRNSIVILRKFNSFATSLIA
jgi:archaellum biogenesis ATPase FlaH